MMKSSVVVASFVLFTTFGLGCVGSSGDALSDSNGAAGAAGSGGTGGTGGESPACEPEGVERACECPDGTQGTQECKDGEFDDCVCFYYPDTDGDKHGDENADPVEDTDKPDGHVGNHDDCDDKDKDRHPGADEVCDGKDNDCDGHVDEGCVEDEICTNGVDDDNDGLVDCADPDCANDANCGGEEYTHWHDGDGDGYTDGASITDKNPNAPAGYTNNPEPGIDCQDDDPQVNPGMQEICGDGKDNNCNGVKDEGCLTDEVCTNGVDDDGDGLVDCADPDCANDANCGGNEYTHYRDGDGDGYTKLGESITDSNPNAPAGYTNTPSTKPDCDDTRASVHPDASEVCNNGIDDNCNGQIDEGCVTNEVCDNNVDDDGDGLVDCADPECANHSSCQQNDEDCGNGVDDDGDGLVDCADSDCTNSSECQVPTGNVTVKLRYTGNPFPTFPMEIRAWFDGSLETGVVSSACWSLSGASVECEFTVPGNSHLLFNTKLANSKWYGDTSGYGIAPCIPASEIPSYTGTCVEVARSGESMGEMCAWVNGVATVFYLTSNDSEPPTSYTGGGCGASDYPWMNGYIPVLASAYQ